jgi:hypothetical protein
MCDEYVQCFICLAELEHGQGIYCEECGEVFCSGSCWRRHGCDIVARERDAQSRRALLWNDVKGTGRWRRLWQKAESACEDANARLSNRLAIRLRMLILDNWERTNKDILSLVRKEAKATAKRQQ